MKKGEQAYEKQNWFFFIDFFFNYAVLRIATMKKGEQAYFTCTADNAYGNLCVWVWVWVCVPVCVCVCVCVCVYI
jgi:hypothetical protein